MFHIEPFNRENVAYAVALGQELHHLGSLQDIPFEWDCAMRSTLDAMISPNWFCRIARDDAGGYTGFVAGYVAPFIFSPRVQGVESAWYVRKGAPNRTRAAVALMRAFVSWALDEKHAVHVQTGDIASISTVAVDALYKHMGFTRYGTIYKYARQ